MQYIENVEKGLVDEVVGGFLVKEWHSPRFKIIKTDNAFKVVYQIGSKRYSLLVKNFDIELNLNGVKSSSLNKRWQIAMAKKFGNKYLEDLEKFLFKDIYNKPKTEKNEIIDNFEYVKNTVNKYREKL